ncbi:killer suppression protein HigA [Fibrobacter sp. UWEL]|uniref:killer suppression protein HigA n=1 Tax=Fibrobacter sp. UWEL TaxID=1896209 RepID=UPI000911696D|nr:killer suppression protein HigA [Fibrobacter sp. UWEL]SHK61876.1 proteic killer suppression protein [Fibrobacter sp. UWEL]
MKILFADRELELCATSKSVALKTMGKVRANLYLKRIRTMMSVDNFEQLKCYSGNFHELVGNRKGQWACNLDQPYRLVSKGAEPNETVLWKNVSEATVLEIVDYH